MPKGKIKPKKNQGSNTPNNPYRLQMAKAIGENEMAASFFKKNIRPLIDQLEKAIDDYSSSNTEDAEFIQTLTTSGIHLINAEKTTLDSLKSKMAQVANSEKIKAIIDLIDKIGKHESEVTRLTALAGTSRKNMIAALVDHILSTYGENFTQGEKVKLSRNKNTLTSIDDLINFIKTLNSAANNSNVQTTIIGALEAESQLLAKIPQFDMTDDYKFIEMCKISYQKTQVDNGRDLESPPYKKIGKVITGVFAMRIPEYTLEMSRAHTKTRIENNIKLANQFQIMIDQLNIIKLASTDFSATKEEQKAQAEKAIETLRDLYKNNDHLSQGLGDTLGSYIRFLEKMPYPDIDQSNRESLISSFNEIITTLSINEDKSILNFLSEIEKNLVPPIQIEADANSNAPSVNPEIQRPHGSSVTQSATTTLATSQPGEDAPKPESETITLSNSFGDSTIFDQLNTENPGREEIKPDKFNPITSAKALMELENTINNMIIGNSKKLSEVLKKISGILPPIEAERIRSIAQNYESIGVMGPLAINFPENIALSEEDIRNGKKPLSTGDLERLQEEATTYIKNQLATKIPAIVLCSLNMNTLSEQLSIISKDPILNEKINTICTEDANIDANAVIRSLSGLAMSPVQRIVQLPLLLPEIGLDKETAKNSIPSEKLNDATLSEDEKTELLISQNRDLRGFIIETISTLNNNTANTYVGWLKKLDLSDFNFANSALEALNNQFPSKDQTPEISYLKSYIQSRVDRNIAQLAFQTQKGKIAIILNDVINHYTSKDSQNDPKQYVDRIKKLKDALAESMKMPDASTIGKTKAQLEEILKGENPNLNSKLNKELKKCLEDPVKAISKLNQPLPGLSKGESLASLRAPAQPTQPEKSSLLSSMKDLLRSSSSDKDEAPPQHALTETEEGILETVLRENYGVEDKAALALNESAKQALYEGTSEEPTTTAREAFTKFLLENVLYDSKTDFDPTKKTNNPEKDATTLKAMLGKKGVALYEAALAEEAASKAFRKAVFTHSFNTLQGPQWGDQLVLYIGGPSGAGKTHSSKVILQEVSKEYSSNQVADNHYVMVDGGIEREVSQMRQLVIQASLQKGYPGIEDLGDYDTLDIKSKVKKAALATENVSLVLPQTYVAQGAADHISGRLAQKLAKNDILKSQKNLRAGQTGRRVIYGQVIADKNMVANQSVGRSLDTTYGQNFRAMMNEGDEATRNLTANAIMLPEGAKPNIPECKAPGQNFDEGVKGSSHAKNAYLKAGSKNLGGEPLVIEVTNDRIFLRFDSKLRTANITTNPTSFSSNQRAAHVIRKLLEMMDHGERPQTEEAFREFISPINDQFTVIIRKQKGTQSIPSENPKEMTFKRFIDQFMKLYKSYTEGRGNEKDRKKQALVNFLVYENQHAALLPKLLQKELERKGLLLEPRVASSVLSSSMQDEKILSASEQALYTAPIAPSEGNPPADSQSPQFTKDEEKSPDIASPIDHSEPELLTSKEAFSDEPQDSANLNQSIHIPPVASAPSQPEAGLKTSINLDEEMRKEQALVSNDPGLELEDTLDNPGLGSAEVKTDQGKKSARLVTPSQPAPPLPAPQEKAKEAFTQETYFAAAGRGDTDLIKRHLTIHPEWLNTTDANGDTALMIAVRIGHGNMVQALLEFNPDLTISNNNNQSVITIINNKTYSDVTTKKLIMDYQPTPSHPTDDEAKKKRREAAFDVFSQIMNEQDPQVNPAEGEGRQNNGSPLIFDAAFTPRPVDDSASTSSTYESDNDSFNESELRSSEDETDEASLETQHHDVFIAGGGPAGLACAIEAVKRGESVLIAEKRKFEYLRGQRIFLDEASRNYLLALLPINANYGHDDKRFFQEITQNTTMRVRDIERFLDRRLTELAAQNEVTVTRMEGSVIQSVNLSEGRLTLETPASKAAGSVETHEFNRLVCADGAAHATANVINQSDPNNPIFEYTEIQSPKKSHHASVYFTITRPDGEPIEVGALQFAEVATKVGGESYLAGLSFNRSKPAFVSDEPDLSAINCTFGGEIPKALYDQISAYNQLTDDKKTTALTQALQIAVYAHMKTVMGSFFEKNNINNGDIVISMKEGNPTKPNAAKKDRLKIQAFETKLTEADKAAHEVGEHQVLLVGDAYRTPNYQFGHGLNHAFQHAAKFGEVLDESLTLDAYNDHAHKISRVVRIGTKLTKAPVVGEKVLLKAGNERPDRIRENFSGLTNPAIASIIARLSLIESDKAGKDTKTIVTNLIQQLETAQTSDNPLAAAYNALESDNIKLFLLNDDQNPLNSVLNDIKLELENFMQESLDTEISEGETFNFEEGTPLKTMGAGRRQTSPADQPTQPTKNTFGKLKEGARSLLERLTRRAKITTASPRVSETDSAVLSTEDESELSTLSNESSSSSSSEVEPGEEEVASSESDENNPKTANPSQGDVTSDPKKPTYAEYEDLEKALEELNKVSDNASQANRNADDSPRTTTTASKNQPNPGSIADPAYVDRVLAGENPEATTNNQFFTDDELRQLDELLNYEDANPETPKREPSPKPQTGKEIPSKDSSESEQANHPRDEMLTDFTDPNSGVNNRLRAAINDNDLSSEEKLSKVTEILSSGANPNTTNVNGVSALMRAAMNGDTAIVKCLLKHGANPDQTKEYDAEKTSTLAVINHALSNLLTAVPFDENTHGVKVNNIQESREAILDKIRENHKNPLLLIPDSESEIERLVAAIERSELEVAKILAKDIVLSVASFKGKPIVMIAYETKNLAIIEAVINGNNDSMKDQQGRTPLIAAIVDGEVEIAKYLIDQLAGINTPDNEENTPLHHAILNNQNDLVAALLEKSVITLNSKNSEGQTPLILAAKRNNPVAFEALVGEQKSKVNPLIMDNDGNTALMYAVQSGNEAMVKKLLEMGALPEQKNKNNNTPLSAAKQLAKTKPELQPIFNLLNDKVKAQKEEQKQQRGPGVFSRVISRLRGKQKAGNGDDGSNAARTSSTSPNEQNPEIRTEFDEFIHAWSTGTNQENDDSASNDNTGTRLEPLKRKDRTGSSRQYNQSPTSESESRTSSPETLSPSSSETSAEDTSPTPLTPKEKKKVTFAEDLSGSPKSSESTATAPARAQSRRGSSRSSDSSEDLSKTESTSSSVSDADDVSDLLHSTPSAKASDSIQPKKLRIYCDFDGTLTSADGETSFRKYNPTLKHADNDTKDNYKAFLQMNPELQIHEEGLKLLKYAKENHDTIELVIVSRNFKHRIDAALELAEFNSDSFKIYDRGSDTRGNDHKLKHVIHHENDSNSPVADRFLFLDDSKDDGRAMMNGVKQANSQRTPPTIEDSDLYTPKPGALKFEEVKKLIDAKLNLNPEPLKIHPTRVTPSGGSTESEESSSEENSNSESTSETADNTKASGGPTPPPTPPTSAATPAAPPKFATKIPPLPATPGKGKVLSTSDMRKILDDLKIEGKRLTHMLAYAKHAALSETDARDDAGLKKIEKALGILAERFSKLHDNLSTTKNDPKAPKLNRETAEELLEAVVKRHARLKRIESEIVNAKTRAAKTRGELAVGHYGIQVALFEGEAHYENAKLKMDAFFAGAAHSKTATIQTKIAITQATKDKTTTFEAHAKNTHDVVSASLRTTTGGAEPSVIHEINFRDGDAAKMQGNRQRIGLHTIPNHFVMQWALARVLDYKNDAHLDDGEMVVNCGGLTPDTVEAMRIISKLHGITCFTLNSPLTMSDKEIQAKAKLAEKKYGGQGILTTANDAIAKPRGPK